MTIFPGRVFSRKIRWQVSQKMLTSAKYWCHTNVFGQKIELKSCSTYWPRFIAIGPFLRGLEGVGNFAHPNQNRGGGQNTPTRIGLISIYFSFFSKLPRNGVWVIISVNDSNLSFYNNIFIIFMTHVKTHVLKWKRITTSQKTNLNILTSVLQRFQYWGSIHIGFLVW